MRLLYIASDQFVPGLTGGSVHVLEVARGLAGLGHEVHAVVRRQRGLPEREEDCGVHWHRIGWTPPHRLFRFRARGAVARIAHAVTPQAVLERYYNFGGEGIALAARWRLPSLLEVNSPAVDHPGSLKGALDRMLLVRPMRRYREWLCRQATALVAPLPAIVPEFARHKTETVSWGANVATFGPERRSLELRRTLGVPEGAVVAVFSGSFRPWHGVHVLEAAARSLAPRADLYFLLAGGPDVGAGRGFRGRQLGRLPYLRMPELLASAEIGVAPYDTARLAQLRLGFYWSPLKIFEYMASGLPTLTIARPPLDEIVRAGREGFHFCEGDPADLARALAHLADDAALRQALGRSGRARVVERYSWARHCDQLDRLLRRIAG